MLYKLLKQSMMKGGYKLLVMSKILGLKGENERTGMARQATAKCSACTVSHIDVDDDGAAIPVDDDIPDERVIVYDSNNPQFRLGALFPSMDSRVWRGTVPTTLSGRWRPPSPSSSPLLL